MIDAALVPAVSAAAVTAVGAAAWIVRYVVQKTWKLIEAQQKLAAAHQDMMANHLWHNTTALVDLKNVIQELSHLVRFKYRDV